MHIPGPTLHIMTMSCRHQECSQFQTSVSVNSDASSPPAEAEKDRPSSHLEYKAFSKPFPALGSDGTVVMTHCCHCVDHDPETP